MSGFDDARERLQEIREHIDDLIGGNRDELSSKDEFYIVTEIEHMMSPLPDDPVAAELDKLRTIEFLETLQDWDLDLDWEAFREMYESQIG